MPKVPIDYKNTIIYKIEHIDKDDFVYVGHTTNWDRRKYSHKNGCINERNSKYNRNLYQMIRENGGWEMFVMVEVEKYPCSDRREADKRETEVMKELKSNMNTIKSYSSEEDKKEYYETHKELRKEYNLEYRKTHTQEIQKRKKEYQELNKEKIKEKKKLYRDLNADLISEKKKEYHEKNKDIIQERKKIYYENNKDKIKEKSRMRYELNKDKIKEKQNEYRELNKDKIKEQKKLSYKLNKDKRNISK